jgi:hypothetical protein
LKTNKTFNKGLRKKKLKIQKIRIKLKNIIFKKLGFKNEIEINKNSIKRSRPKKIIKKRIRIEVEIATKSQVVIFKGEERKEGKKKINW